MMKALVSALLLSVALGGSAYANPVTDFLDGVFTQPGVFIQQGEQPRAGHWGRGHRTRSHWPDWSTSAPHGGHTWNASFYGGGPRKFEPNTHTANGERFNQWAMTAAHRTLPMGTHLQVCYRGCAVVRINDRGPALWTGRSLDLSRGAATAIGMVAAGSAPVQVTVLD